MRNIFENREWVWWELALVKWSVFFIGLSIGAYWHEFIAPYALFFFVAGFLMALVAVMKYLEK